MATYYIQLTFLWLWCGVSLKRSLTQQAYWSLSLTLTKLGNICSSLKYGLVRFWILEIRRKKTNLWNFWKVKSVEKKNCEKLWTCHAHVRMWTSCSQVMNKLWTSHKEVVIKWISPHKVMIKLWTNCEKIVNKSWTSHEQVVNQFYKFEHVMKKSWASCEQVLNKLWTNYEQSWGGSVWTSPS